MFFYNLLDKNYSTISAKLSIDWLIIAHLLKIQNTGGRKQRFNIMRLYYYLRSVAIIYQPLKSFSAYTCNWKRFLKNIKIKIFIF